jgi:WD40 repeat protein
MSFERFPSAVSLLLALLLLAPLGCGGGHKDFTPEAFGTITAGMPESKVVEILGKPNEAVEAAGVRRLFWESKGKYFSISFEGGKVVAPLAHADKGEYELMLGLTRAASKSTPGAAPAAPGALSADLPRIQPKAKFHLPAKRVSGSLELARLSSDGKRLAVAYDTPTYKSITQIWDLSAQPKVVAEFEGCRLALSPSGKRVLVGSKIFDVESKKQLASVPNFNPTGFFRDDHTVVTTDSSDDITHAATGKIVQWNIDKDADAGSFEIPDNRYDAALAAKNGTEVWIFMSRGKFEVECYDLGTKKLLRTVKPESEDAKDPFTRFGTYIAVAPDSSAFSAHVREPHFFDAESGKILGVLPADIWDSSAGFVPGGTRYFARPGGAKAKKVGVADNEVVLYDWKKGKAIAALTGHSEGEEEPLAAASGDGNTAVSISKKGEGLIFDISSCK